MYIIIRIKLQMVCLRKGCQWFQVMMRKTSKFSASFLPEGFHWRRSGLEVTWNPTHSGIGNSSQNFLFQKPTKRGSKKSTGLQREGSTRRNQGNQTIEMDTIQDLLRPEWHKMWSRLTAHICHFFWLITRNQNLSDKKCHILMFRDKKCHNLTCLTRLVRSLTCEQEAKSLEPSLSRMCAFS